MGLALGAYGFGIVFDHLHFALRNAVPLLVKARWLFGHRAFVVRVKGDGSAKLAATASARTGGLGIRWLSWCYNGGRFALDDQTEAPDLAAEAGG